MKKMLNDINKKIFSCNEKCALSKHRGGNLGNINAKILFIAQCPGKQGDTVLNEDIVPFGFYKDKADKVKSEVVFDWIIQYLGLTDNDFYLTNVIKCATNVWPEDFSIVKKCVAKHLIKEIEVMKNLKYVICLGEQAKIATILIDGMRNKYKMYYLWHPSYIVRNGGIDVINRKLGAETTFSRYKEKLSILKEELFMAKEVYGKDVEVGKIYKSTGKGVVVKITKKEGEGKDLVFYGLTHPKFALVKVLPEMRLLVVDDSEKYDFSVVEPKEEPKEESKKEEKVEKKKETKKEEKVEKVPEEKEEKKVKKEKKNSEDKTTRKTKIDRKELDILYAKLKAHMTDKMQSKINKNYIVFRVDDIKCRLYQYDCIVVADKKIKDIEPLKVFDDYVKYNVSQLFKVIGYKDN